MVNHETGTLLERRNFAQKALQHLKVVAFMTMVVAAIKDNVSVLFIAALVTMGLEQMFVALELVRLERGFERLMRIVLEVVSEEETDYDE